MDEKDALILNPELLQFIERMGIYYEAYGIPRIGGRIFALFLITTTPLSADQIAQALQASRASVSTNVRALIANGWVEKVNFLGERVDYYRFSPSAWERVMERRRASFAPLKAMAEQAKVALPPEHPAQEQLAGMAAWAELLIGHYDNLIAAWQARMAERQQDRDTK